MHQETLKEYTRNLKNKGDLGLPWWSSGWDSVPMQGAPWSIPGQGTRSHTLSREFRCWSETISHAATKTWWSQINKYFFFLKKMFKLLKGEQRKMKPRWRGKRRIMEMLFREGDWGRPPWRGNGQEQIQMNWESKWCDCLGEQQSRWKEQSEQRPFEQECTGCA